MARPLRQQGYVRNQKKKKKKERKYKEIKVMT